MVRKPPGILAYGRYLEHDGLCLVSIVVRPVDPGSRARGGTGVSGLVDFSEFRWFEKRPPGHRRLPSIFLARHAAVKSVEPVLGEFNEVEVAKDPARRGSRGAAKKARKGRQLRGPLGGVPVVEVHIPNLEAEMAIVEDDPHNPTRDDCDHFDVLVLVWEILVEEGARHKDPHPSPGSRTRAPESH